MHHLLHQNKTKNNVLAHQCFIVCGFVFLGGRLHFLTVGFDFACIYTYVYIYVYTMTCLPSPAFWVIFYLPGASVHMSPAIWAVSNLLVLECFAASCPRSEHLHAEEFVLLHWSISLHLPAGVNWCAHSCWQFYELLGLFRWLACSVAIHLSLWRLVVLGTFVLFCSSFFCHHLMFGRVWESPWYNCAGWRGVKHQLTYKRLGWELCF